MDERRIEEAIKKVNRRIGEIRSKQGITQARLAEKLDIDLKVFQRFETNRNLTLRNIFRLKAVLDCDVKEFFYEPKSNGIGRGRPRKNDKFRSRR